MKHAFFIMELFQTGNIGPHNIKKITGQEKEGYISPEKALWAMQELKENKHYELNQKGNTFTILPVWTVE